jgi:hypothetical protein
MVKPSGIATPPDQNLTATLVHVRFGVELGLKDCSG